MTSLSEIKLQIAKARIKKPVDSFDPIFNLGLNYAIEIIEIYKRTEKIRKYAGT